MITPIMANSIVAQTQNVSAINHGEESKGQLINENSQNVIETKQEEQHSTVVASEDSNKTDTRHDASEEGKNKYFNNRNDKKKNKQDPFGAVVKKKGASGFDISV